MAAVRTAVAAARDVDASESVGAAIASPSTLPLRSEGSQAEHFTPADVSQGELVSPALRMLRAAIDDCGWKHDAVAHAIGVSAKYFSRMLSGEKAWTVRHLAALPDDVEALFIRKYAESFGLIVVERVSDEMARQQLACGLFNMLAPRLPAKASAMARADLPVRGKVASR